MSKFEEAKELIGSMTQEERLKAAKEMLRRSAFDVIQARIAASEEKEEVATDVGSVTIEVMKGAEMDPAGPYRRWVHEIVVELALDMQEYGRFLEGKSS